MPLRTKMLKTFNPSLASTRHRLHDITYVCIILYITCMHYIIMPLRLETNYQLPIHSSAHLRNWRARRILWLGPSAVQTRTPTSYSTSNRRTKWINPDSADRRTSDVSSARWRPSDGRRGRVSWRSLPTFRRWCRTSERFWTTSNRHRTPSFRVRLPASGRPSRPSSTTPTTNTLTLKVAFYDRLTSFQNQNS